MAAMNRGANDSNGHIVGVIHEKFIVDGSDWLEGAHSVFREGKHEIVVARGNDLQERKRLLVKGADALVVLPGGPGTWDEVNRRCSPFVKIEGY
jgi:predicted Rossmann-fold nucleotide-binding protein